MHRASERVAIGRTIVVAVVVVIIVLAAGAAVYLGGMSPKSTTSSSSSSLSSTSTTSTSATTPSSSTLVMDDQNWPIDGVNVINFGSEVPWPDWWEYSVYQPLVTVNDTAEFSSGAIQYLPVLATNYTSTNGNMTWTFNLRQNVTFSNGDPFNAYQLWADLYSEYYLSGNSSGWWQSYTIFDMSNVDFGPNTLALMNSTNDQLVHPNSQMLTIMSNSSWPIHVTGPNQIVFQLKAPFLYLLGTFVSYIGMVFDTQYVLNNGGIGTPGAPNTKFDTSPIPGTGPYSISGVSTNSYVQFAQYSGYWGSNLTPAQIASNPILDPGHYKSVVINDVADDLSRYTALSSGAAQIAAITSTAEWPLVLGNPNEFSYTTLPSWSSEGPFAVAINANLYPTNITAVRQAIVQAINYSDIIQTVFNGEMLPTMGPESPLYPQYYDLGNFSAYQYNPTNATNILKAAGLNPSSLGTLTFRTEADCAMCAGIAQIVQADLEQIGFTVTISQVAGSAYDTVYGSYSTNVANAAQIGQLSLLGGQSWAPSALTAADNWVSLVSNTSSWGNWAGFSTPQIQACVNAFTSTSSVSQIQTLCKTAQAQIYNDAPYAWIGNAKLWYYTGSLVWKTGTIKSFDLDPVWDGVNTMPLINTVVPG